MKVKYLIFSIIIVMLTSLILTRGGYAQPPPIPASFFGMVKASGSNVPLSSKVSAWIDGVKYAETSVVEFNFDTVYTIDIPGDILSTPEIEGGKPGDTITFLVNNSVANQSAIWQSGTNSELNLTIIQPVGNFKIYLPLIFK
jgi:hypothetical protein